MTDPRQVQAEVDLRLLARLREERCRRCGQEDRRLLHVAYPTLCPRTASEDNP